MWIRRVLNAVGGLCAAVAFWACDAPRSDHPLADAQVRLRDDGATQGATLSIPRYKIYQDPAEPDRLWVGLGMESGPDTFHSGDGGRTWTPIAEVGWEYHMSMAGSEDGYIHFIDRGTPAATYRRMQGTDFEPEHTQEFADYGAGTTSGNIAVNGREVVVFTRNRDDDGSPVTYHRSLDGGATWETGTVAGTGNPTGGRHRIGSVVIDGQITLVYWQGRDGESGDTVTLFRWDGRAFSPLDHIFTTRARSPWTREFGVTQDAGGRIHLAIWDTVDGRKVVRHSQRSRASAWSPAETVAAWDNDDIHPQLAAYGQRVVLLFLYHAASNRSDDARVFYKTWDEIDGWSPTPQPLSAPARAGARFPVAPQSVAPAGGYVPVVWTEGDAVIGTRLELD